jgi:nitroreductase
MIDVYQVRYLAHQARKKQQMTGGDTETPRKWSDNEARSFIDFMHSRRSQRTFNRDSITIWEMDMLLDSATYAPSSCNRHGIGLHVVREQSRKELLGGLLVGGVGWVHRADTVVLLMADPEAYKSPNEKEFMHYCDAGFTAMNMWLTAEALNIGCAYINPNIREENRQLFVDTFGDRIFVGALAFGKYDTRPREAEHPNIEEIVV